MLKTNYQQLFLLCFFLLGAYVQAQVKIGDNATTINPSAVFEVESTTKGLLPPRMTTAERDAIATPATGLTIFNTTTNCLNFYVGSGWNETCGTASLSLTDQYQTGSVFCASGPTAIVDVTNPTTGKTWMDRNLGASQVATSSTDAQAYGDLYQWGRGADGHQCRNSTTTSTLSSADQPGHGAFITGGSDWRSPENTNLWQGVNGTNNPCPTGYRLPTETELDNEFLSWVQAPISSTNNAAGAFASPLKLPMAGIRNRSNGSLNDVGTRGDYWSSTVSGTNSRSLFFSSSSASMGANHRANGYSVRCLKD